MAKAKTNSGLFAGLVILAVIGAVFLAQATKQAGPITGNTVYPIYASVGSETARVSIQGTLDEGGNGICETYAWGAQLKTADGKSLGAKFNVCSNDMYGFNYECAQSTRTYVFPREIGLICGANKVCDIVAGKATCVNA